MTIIYKTPFTEKTGVKYPIIMGAFAGIGRSEFAAPASEAGILGVITAHNFKTPEDLKMEIEKMQSMTSKPFAINCTVFPSIGRFTNSMKSDDFLPYIEVALDLGVTTFTTSAYKAKSIGDRVHQAGCTWIHKCATLMHAVSAEKHGADFIVIVGLEGTGFKNPMQNTTLIHMTTAKKMLKAHLIAAGGIGDARGFLSALMMGASAVCFGTLLMATTECPLPAKYKMEKLANLRGYDDEDYYKKIYHLSLKDSAGGSMAVSLIDDVVSMKERIDRIINDADEILKQWGITGILDLK